MDTFCQVYSRIDYDGGTNIDISNNADVCANDILIHGSFTGGGTICTGPLPVTLISFTSAINKNNVSLNWITEAELNNKGFDVERKMIAPNSAWQKVGFVNGYGTVQEQKNYLYIDNKLQAGRYSYRIKQIDYNGNFEYFELPVDVIIGAPENFSMSQNYPNPSNPRSKIDFQIPVDGDVSLTVYDMLGKEISVLVNEFKKADFYSVEFDGSSLATGVYFYRILIKSQSITYNKTLKMILVK